MIEKVYQQYCKRIYRDHKHRRGTWRIKHTHTQIIDSWLEPFENPPKSIFDEEWKNLFILDAARHDLYEEVEGETEKRTTLAGQSTEYIEKKLLRRKFFRHSICNSESILLGKTVRRTYRKKNLFSELENDIISPRDFLMVHLHRTEFHQHLYGDPTAVMDKNKLKKLYQETDELAGKILEKAEGKYDTIIFMSDHGLPVKNSHNENAFYSSNKPLFDEVPKLTDLHDKILEMTA